MGKLATLHSRIDEKTKESAEKILKAIGVNHSEAINLFYRQIVLRRGIPFSLEIPNEETLDAINELENGKKTKSFKSVKKLFEDNVSKIPELIQELYKIVQELEILFPNRSFALDGHLVGSIGEVLAANYYNLTLEKQSTKNYDAKTEDGRLVQIKATQGKSIGIRSEPVYLLVIQIKSDGSFTEVYNGPGKLAWDKSGAMQKNGQRNISVSKLRELMNHISSTQKIKIYV